MDFGGVVFFGVIGAIIIVPQILRHQERQRLHDTIRQCLAKGQPVPPELFQALRWRRRVYASDYGRGYQDYDAYPAGAYAPPPFASAAAPAAATTAEPPPGAAYAGAAPMAGAPATGPSPAPLPPLFVGPSMVERDLRRGIVWMAIGLGLIAAGAAFYAGLYYDGGAPEVFSSFAALGAIPLFVGLTYLALWFFNRKTKA
jgi:hypothetical protein